MTSITFEGGGEDKNGKFGLGVGIEYTKRMGRRLGLGAEASYFRTGEKTYSVTPSGRQVMGDLSLKGPDVSFAMGLFEACHFTH